MPKSAKPCFAFIFCLLLCLCCLGAAYAYEIDAGGDYNLSNIKSQININTTEPVTLQGKYGGAINCTVAGVNLTLDGAKVTKDEGCALSFTGAGNRLTIEGKNTVKSGEGSPGIRVEKGTELTIQGEGSLTVTGGSCGAGIGGGDCAYGGTITIESGTITAKGGYNGAGIGGGSCRDGGIITINGGTVTATGGKSGGAGIGGASDNGGGTILITGGTIIANGSEDGGCGIGEGWNSSSRHIFNGTITITGGNITANGGIGGGGYSSGGIITIEGGTVVVDGRIGGNGGEGRDDGLITITGGTITASEGIGGGSDIIISGGDITATGCGGRAGIDAGREGENKKTKNITISGGTIVATGGAEAAGIGCGCWSRAGKILITGGNITAIGGGPGEKERDEFTGGGAGIGGGRNGRCEEITISGGTVKAIGGEDGAGIGGGKYGESCKTTITGDSLVYAQRGEGDTYDIGAGDGGQNMQLCLYIKEKAAVFLGTNKCAPPAAKGHTKKRPGNKTDPMVAAVYDGELAIFGIAGTGESPWTDAQGGWFVLYKVQYDANGAQGVCSESTGPVHVTALPITAAGADGLTKEGYTFTCWNTQANLRGKTYFPGDEITFSSSETELTLYAQWDKAE